MGGAASADCIPHEPRRGDRHLAWGVSPRYLGHGIYCEPQRGDRKVEVRRHLSPLGGLSNLVNISSWGYVRRSAVVTHRRQHLAEGRRSLTPATFRCRLRVDAPVYGSFAPPALDTKHPSGRHVRRPYQPEHTKEIPCENLRGFVFSWLWIVLTEEANPERGGWSI